MHALFMIMAHGGIAFKKLGAAVCWFPPGAIH
jgi:hypothetical protein